MTGKAFHKPKSGRFHTLDNDPAEFVHERRGQFLLVNAELVQLIARELAREAGVPCDSFKASRSWVQKLMCRAGFSICRNVNLPEAPC